MSPNGARWYIHEKDFGIVWIDAANDATTVKNTYLDYGSFLHGGTENGMLSMAFHPDYALNGFVYLFMVQSNGPTGMQSVIARFTESADGNSLIPSSREDILIYDQNYDIHNGGQIAFGNDGYLYAAFGDGGTQNDQQNNGQNLNTFDSTVIRIDVLNGSPYSIPPDNPFANGGGLPEIWAYGFRNPWHWSFDKATGNMWIGDVSQDTWEEVNWARKGLNYGWGCREGFVALAGSNCTSSDPFEDPAIAYSHASDGASVTGGYVYHGTEITGLQNVYVFGDWSNGKIWGMTEAASGTFEKTLLIDSAQAIATFGEANNGELYLMPFNFGAPSGIYKLEPVASQNGIIVQAEDYSDFFDTSPGNTGNAYRNDDVDLEATADSGGGFNVGWTAATEWLTYQVDIPTTGEYAIRVRVASNAGGGNYDLSIDAVSVLTNTVGNTGGWQSFITQSSTGTTCLSAGTHNMRLDFLEGDINVNWYQLEMTQQTNSCGGTQTPAEKYGTVCANCHGPDGSGGSVGVPINDPNTMVNVQNGDLVQLAQYIEANMPSGNVTGCDASCASAMAGYISGTLWTNPPNTTEVPGPRQLSLLTRYEFRNTLADLLGISVDEQAVSAFPAENKVHGFDNNAALNVITGRH
ncbi:MAG: hypothetical protein COA42_10870, partial [Alteromonadaceae bacterium]